MKVIKRPLTPAKVIRTGPEGPAPQRKRGNPPPEKEKSVTLRLPPNHMAMVAEDMEALEADRSECIRRAIRLQHQALSGWSSSLTIKHSDGRTVTIHIMSEGAVV